MAVETDNRNAGLTPEVDPQQEATNRIVYQDQLRAVRAQIRDIYEGYAHPEVVDCLNDTLIELHGIEIDLATRLIRRS